MPLGLHDLLAKGYFPKELPPPFTTVSYATALAGAGVTPDVAFLDPAKTYKNQTQQHSQSARHNMVRAGGLRRDLSIPNPVHFLRLADHVVRHWTSLQTHAGTSPYSLSKPVDTQPDRAISPEHSLSERPLHRARLRATGRFLLRTDIARFFPSVYTHSLPWALMGKQAAKAAHQAHTLAGTWQDLVDFHSQKLNTNQTVGLPIGPDTSRLLAECILARVDSELSVKVTTARGMRYIDDYEFVTDTRSEAEAILSQLQHLLSQFELAVNSSKTVIEELPSELESPSVIRCRDFVFRDGGARTQHYDLQSYFGLLFEILRSDPDEGRLKYGIGRLRSVEVLDDNWAFFEDLLAQCVTVEPATIPQVCEQVVYYQSKGKPFRVPLWTAVLNGVVCERLPLGFASESAWAMWLMKQLTVALSTRAARIVADSDDSVAALMALGLAARGLGPMADLANLNRFDPASELWEANWLLCYQGNLMGWLGVGGPARLATVPAFEFLKTRGVSFFDIGVAPPPPARTPITSGGGSGGGY